MSEDILTQEGLIKKTFDPFKETTLIEMDRYESFDVGLVDNSYGLLKTVNVSVGKFDSKEGECFFLSFWTADKFPNWKLGSTLAPLLMTATK